MGLSILLREASLARNTECLLRAEGRFVRLAVVLHTGGQRQTFERALGFAGEKTICFRAFQTAHRHARLEHGFGRP